MKGRQALRGALRGFQAYFWLLLAQWGAYLLTGTRTGWFYSAAGTAESVTALMAVGTVAVVAGWNTWEAFCRAAGKIQALSERESGRDYLAHSPYFRQQDGGRLLSDQDVEVFRRSMAASMTSVSTLRYLSPPSPRVFFSEGTVSLDPQGLMPVASLSPRVIMTGPQALTGICGKCALPMADHYYHGTRDCITVPGIGAQVRMIPRCKGCGGELLLYEMRNGRSYCTRCVTG